MNAHRKWRLGVAGAAALAAGFLAILGAGPALSQEGDPVLGKSVWLGQVNCKDCHGSLANGVQDVPQEPQGYNLRETVLTPEDLREVVRCGRPGGLMPSFQRSAWTERAPCYGMTAAEVGDLIPDRGERSLPDRLLDALVAMIFADFVGKAEITFEICRDFLGETASRCNGFPRAGN